MENSLELGFGSGRRDRPGQVLIQTLNPGPHDALPVAKDHDYEGFYAIED
ncbi:MAG: hypothetical protein LBS60_02665 [Deltaproteobacteria bacterium]|nr:hypothetical protein [Deltaproteobacteria bacterium]